MPAIRNCLEHRHSYVRRNAVMAIYTIYRLVFCTLFNKEVISDINSQDFADLSCMYYLKMNRVHVDDDF